MFDSLRHFLNGQVDRPVQSQSREGFLIQFFRWRQRRKGIKLLHDMPDYLLKDIGVSRGEIETAVVARHEVLPVDGIGRGPEDLPWSTGRERKYH